MLYISELIEEHARIAKLIGQRGTYVGVLPFFSSGDHPYCFLARHPVSRPLIYLRLIASATHTIFYPMSRSVLAKFLEHVARHILVISILHCFVHSRCFKSLHVVHVFLSDFTGGETNLFKISWTNRGGTWFRRYCDILWDLRLACPSVLVPESECQR